MQLRASAALVAIAAVALLPLTASANRNLRATWSNPAGAPFALYNCRGEDVYDVRHELRFGSYFSNESGKEITELAVHYRLLRLDGSQIIGFNIVAPKRVTPGTKNSLEFRLRVPVDQVDHIECAPAYAKFSDGTEWKDTHYNDNPDPRPSAVPPASQAPAAASPSPPH